MNSVLKRFVALALAGGLVLALAGCSLFGPSKANSYTCDRGTCSSSVAMNHCGQTPKK